MKASWLTTLFGALVIFGDLGAIVSHYMAENPMPTTPEDWFKWGMGLAMGIGLAVAKSFNVSHSGTNAEPHVVESPKP